MGCRSTIDRGKVLDAAERLVTDYGAASLTIGGVANAAGIGKSGVQSSFRSKEGLIEAMLIRWGESYERSLEALAGKSPDPMSALRAHVGVTLGGGETNARGAALVAALLQSPHHLTWVRDWYGSRFRDIDDLCRLLGMRARMVFFATEGLFFLHHLGLMGLSPTDWQRYIHEIVTLADAQ
ncbi:TetR/AcrR family transcriptional regulator [Ottowia thiooxydans]|uniref:TetR/AcrR family transcriptional regulator n=1 Tax=Ottowia thiooxydans TaxID=219182 RepID=UPI00048CE4AA|nr:TetR/AcrR family transcriptional regulator [Ottowia thiooxydans]